MTVQVYVCLFVLKYVTLIASAGSSDYMLSGFTKHVKKTR